MHVGHLASSQLIVDVQLRWCIAVHQVLFPVHLVQISNRSDRYTTALQGLLEGGTEITVEVGVDQRIQRAVEVAYPKHHRYDRVATLAGVAEGCNDVPVGWK